MAAVLLHVRPKTTRDYTESIEQFAEVPRTGEAIAIGDKEYRVEDVVHFPAGGPLGARVYAVDTTGEPKKFMVA